MTAPGVGCTGVGAVIWMPGIGPAGDQYFVPANMTTAERAMKGDFGNGGALGSDTTGAPADNPTDHQARVQFSRDN